MIGLVMAGLVPAILIMWHSVILIDDRRDKPQIKSGDGDDAPSFAPLLSLFINLLHKGDETPSLVVVHYCHETTRLIDDVIFYLIFLWTAAAFHGSLLRQNEILMVPLRIARDIVPCNTNFVA
jgi:hypothetical protein